MCCGCLPHIDVTAVIGILFAIVTVLMSNTPVFTINPLGAFQLFNPTHMLSFTTHLSGCHCCHIHPLVQITLSYKSHIVALAGCLSLAGRVLLC